MSPLSSGASRRHVAHHQQRAMTQTNVSALTAYTHSTPSVAISDAADRRTGHRRDLHHDRVQADRVGQMLARHERRHQRLPRRRVERAEGRADRGQRVDRPRMVSPRKVSTASADRREGHAGLRDEHHAAAVGRVGERAARDRKEDDRHQPDEADHAERERPLVGGHEQRDVPQQRGRLHVRAGERDEQPDPEQAEVPVLKRDERGLR